MKYWLAALVMGLLPAQPSFSAELIEKVWNHGSKDCSKNPDPAIEIFRFNAATYILRQNKCVHFEAPFIYVLFGTHTVFVQDTGATADPAAFPLHDVVQKLVAEHDSARPAEDWRLLVTHSHSHSDHTAADPQFRDKPGVTLIEPNAEAVRSYFALADWPEGTATIDLGARELVVMPIPGHQGESIAVYDPQTGWLLTGDSLYPGRLYVRDWKAYRSSIQRLVEFSKTRRISAVMGTHVEMSRTPGKAYPPGSTFQPDETALALAVEDLLLLDENLQQTGSKPKKLTTAKFVVTPVR